MERVGGVHCISGGRGCRLDRRVEGDDWIAEGFRVLNRGWRG